MKMSAPWRDPRTGIWKLRRRVPARYWPVAGNKVIKISTSTADRKEADRKWPGILIKWAEMEAAWERAGRVVTLDAAAAGEVALGWARWIADGARLDTGPAEKGPTSHVFDEDDKSPDRIARMWDRVEAHTDEALRVANITIAPESRPLLLEAMQRQVHGAYMRADLLRMNTARPGHRGDGLSSLRRGAIEALTPPKDTPPAEKVTLASILAGWKAVATVKPRVAGDVAGMFKTLEAFLGYDDAARVTTADLRRWRDEAIAGGLNNNTFNGRISMVRSVFAQAQKDGRLPNNPVVNDVLRLSKTKAVSPLPYPDDVAAQILNASRLEARASIRWAHWVMAFTGMRVGEVLQLYVSDIREDGGVHYISINEDDLGKSVKTSDKRSVPIHPALIREGFLAYAAAMPKGQLFPDKKPDKYGMIGGRAYNVTGRWVWETVGVTDRRYAPDHSWRHRMEDELRDHGVEQEIRDMLCGHVGNSTGRLYGVKGLALRRLADAVALLKVPEGVAMPDA